MQLKIHQLNILKRLEKGPRTLKSFSHNDQSAHLSVHFERYLAELQAAGYVIEIQENWHLTHSGYAAVAEKQQKSSEKVVEKKPKSEKTAKTTEKKPKKAEKKK